MTRHRAFAPTQRNEAMPSPVPHYSSLYSSAVFSLIFSNSLTLQYKFNGQEAAAREAKAIENVQNLILGIAAGSVSDVAAINSQLNLNKRKVTNNMEIKVEAATQPRQSLTRRLTISKHPRMTPGMMLLYFKPSRDDGNSTNPINA